MPKSSQFIHRFAGAIVLPVLLIVMLLQIWQLQALGSVKTNLSGPAITTTLKPALPSVQKPTLVAAAAPSPQPTTAQKTAVSAATATKTSAKTTSPAVAPASDIASASVCPSQDQIAQVSAVLLCMTNFARHFHGLGSVSTNLILTSAATTKANDIITCNDFSHTACGHPFDYWITAKGFTGNCSGENIAEGQPTPGAVFVAWMNSSGHRANILNGSYNQLGVAEQSSSHGPVWVMELGGC